MHHSDVIGGRGGEMTSLVIKQCQNGRSRVARSALEAVRDLFRFLRKSLLGQLDAAVKVLLGSFSFKNYFSSSKVVQRNLIFGVIFMVNNYRLLSISYNMDSDGIGF